MTILDRARRAGCVAAGIAILGCFFIVGALVSLFSGDFATTLQSIVVALLLLGGAVWLVRRRTGR